MRKINRPIPFCEKFFQKKVNLFHERREDRFYCGNFAEIEALRGKTEN